MNKLLFFVLLSLSTTIFAQNPFEREIIAFEKQDSLAMPAKGKRLFFGSSSFRLWKNFDQDMQGSNALNRGFGGSTLQDALVYFDRMVAKYQPAWVFMYEGDNDLTKGQSPAFIAAEYDDFAARLKKAVPQAKLVFVSARPSLARVLLADKQRELNAMIKAKGGYFIDMHAPFYLPDGTLMQDIFVADRLHLNEKGYVIFAKQIQAFIQQHP